MSDEERKDEITFFSETDLNEKGKTASAYPAWYFSTMVDDLKEDIRRDELLLESEAVPSKQLPMIRDRIKRLKAKLESIESGLPRLSGDQENKMRKVNKDLGKEISNRMFTRSQMQKGIADGHQEARRMIEPSITVTPEIAEFAQACDVPISNGKISRGGAEKIWKITSKYFGDVSNTEVLRRD